MQRWGLIINCKEHKLGVQQENEMDCLHLEDEMFSSNLANLIGTSATGEETVHEEPQQGPNDLDSNRESVSDHTPSEVVLSVQENTEALDDTKSPEMGDESSDESLK